MVGLEPMIVPGLNYARIGSGDIDLPELLELFPIGAEHLHQIPSLVRDGL
jgi:hypothetical protein